MNSFFKITNEKWSKAIECNELIETTRKEMNESNLIVFSKPFPFGHSHTFTNELMDYQSSIEVKSADFFKSQFASSYLKNIKRLFISNLYDADNLKKNLDFLANFDQLEQLEIYFTHLNTTTLNLSKLKILSIKYCWFDKVILSTQNLTHLNCYDYIDRIEISNPNQLKNLDTDDLPAKFFINNLTKLSNLETLICQTLYLDDLPANFLQLLPKLNEIHYFIDDLEHSSLKELRRQLHDFELQNKISLLISGFETVEFKTKFIQSGYRYFTLDESNMKQFADNYTKLKAPVIPYPTQINYTTLVEHFNELPADFFAKFVCIERIVVDAKVADFKSLIGFIGKSASLNKLALLNTGLTQEFYDNLIECTNLKGLAIKESNWTVNNFNFILNSHFLRRIELEFDDEHGLSNQLIDIIYVKRSNVPMFAFKNPNLNLHIGHNGAKFVVKLNDETILLDKDNEIVECLKAKIKNYLI